MPKVNCSLLYHLRKATAKAWCGVVSHFLSVSLSCCCCCCCCCLKCQKVGFFVLYTDTTDYKYTNRSCGEKHGRRLFRTIYRMYNCRSVLPYWLTYHQECKPCPLNTWLSPGLSGYCTYNSTNRMPWLILHFYLYFTIYSIQNVLTNDNFVNQKQKALLHTGHTSNQYYLVNLHTT